MSVFADVFEKKAVIGMIHLRPLPGSHRYEGSMNDCLDWAMRDVKTLEDGGVDGIMIENFFDAPFYKSSVPPETVAGMTRIITEIRKETTLPLGVNVLRNDGLSALAIATACSCQFIRVNILSGAMVTDQGIIEGQSAELLRLRKNLQSSVMIWADCLVKHAVPFHDTPMEQVAADTFERGGADALIISGVGTGKPTNPEDVKLARKGAPHAPILIGSGVTTETVTSLLEFSDGVIVGTSTKVEGKVENVVDLDRVKALVAASKAGQ